MNVTLYAEPVARIGSMEITNSLINATVLMIVLVIFAFFFRKRISMIPGRVQAAVETFIEVAMTYIDQVTGSRKKTVSFLPFICSLFLFILLSNWMGLLPGTGSLGVWQIHEGSSEFIPLFRPANGDLNMTIAMALVSVIGSHVLGVIAIGFFAHWNRFFTLGSIWKAVKSGKPMNIVVALIEGVVGLIEFVSEIAKVLSLSLRLFGNIFAGEVLLTVIASIFAYLLPLPFMALELIVGIVQALVFSMLTLVYLSILTDVPHGNEEESHAHAAKQSAHATG
jgi:F-type H+-transporting ATPase subunit a